MLVGSSSNSESKSSSDIGAEIVGWIPLGPGAGSSSGFSDPLGVCPGTALPLTDVALLDVFDLRLCGNFCG